MVMGSAALPSVRVSGHVAADSEGAFRISGLMSDTHRAAGGAP